jgi:hypothetical protein
MIRAPLTLMIASSTGSQFAIELDERIGSRVDQPQFAGSAWVRSLGFAVKHCFPLNDRSTPVRRLGGAPFISSI